MSDEIKNRTVYMLCRTDKSDDGTDIYVGSTSSPLEKRLQEHRNSSRSKRDGGIKLYVKMHTVGLENWKIVPLLTFACNKITIRNYERSWYDLLNADLNTVSPVVDLKKKKDYMFNYRKLNKEIIKQRKADYHETNKATIKQRQADYRKNNKEAIKQRHSNYYENNKTTIKKRHEDYRKLNKEDIKLYHANKYIENKKTSRYPKTFLQLVKFARLIK